MLSSKYAIGISAGRLHQNPGLRAIVLFSHGTGTCAQEGTFRQLRQPRNLCLFLQQYPRREKQREGPRTRAPDILPRPSLPMGGSSLPVTRRTRAGAPRNARPHNAYVLLF
ncbi:hypothetical protein CNY67_01755 [Desulfovibrio sp. G11]|nr:hypothetical protein CNY67_01755 [Desulfovibrio sp. G11]